MFSGGVLFLANANPLPTRGEAFQRVHGVHVQRQASSATQIATGEAYIPQHMIIEFGKLCDFLAGAPVVQKVGNNAPGARLNLTGSDELCVFSHCTLL